MNKENPRVAPRRASPKARGYSEAGASQVRRALKGFVATSGAPNEDIDWNNYTLRQRGRLLYMASPVATAAINTNRTKIVGTGLTLKSAVRASVLGLSEEAAKAWEKNTEAEFALWSEKRENCDALGLSNFFALQQLAVKSWLMSGDVFALLTRVTPDLMNPYSLRVRLVEADRVSTPSAFGGLSAGGVTEGKTPAGNRIFDGVEVDSAGRVVAYHIRNTYPAQMTLVPTEWTRVKVRGELSALPNILHIMDSERPDQYRGVTYLAQVIEPLLQLRRYTESELMAALVQSFFSAWVITNTNPAEIPFNEVGAGDVHGATEVDAFATTEPPEGISRNGREYEMGPGTINHMQEGEDIKFGDPNIPTAGFGPFVTTVCRLVGAALELPYDVLIKEFNASYSASRGALLEAWESIKMRRAWFADDFCQPIYEVWLAEAVARGRVAAPGFFEDPILRAAWCGAYWIGPVQGQLDPLKEVRAAVTGVSEGFKTHEQVTRELGNGDWEDNVSRLKFENAMLAGAQAGTLAGS